MEGMTRLFAKCQGSTLTQTVGAAVFKFTNAKLFVFSTSTSWMEREVRCNDTKAVSLASTPNSGRHTEGSLQYLVYVPKMSMDILGQVTQQANRTLIRNMEVEEQTQHALAKGGIL